MFRHCGRKYLLSFNELIFSIFLLWVIIIGHCLYHASQTMSQSISCHLYLQVLMDNSSFSLALVATSKLINVLLWNKNDRSDCRGLLKMCSENITNSVVDSLCNSLATNNSTYPYCTGLEEYIGKFTIIIIVINIHFSTYCACT